MKIVKVVSIVFFCVVLYGCGVDEVSKRVMDDIESIGVVNLEDEQQITKIDELYNTLTDKQKNQVKNYNDLLDAKDELEGLKEEEIEKNKQAKESMLNSTEYKYSIYISQTIKDSLKDRDSFELRKIRFLYPFGEDGSEVDTLPYMLLFIEYSGHNSFGGAVVKNQISEISKKGIVSSFDPDDSYSYKYSYYEEFFKDNEKDPRQEEKNINLDLILENINWLNPIKYK